MTTVVTGGTGVVGQALLKHLVDGEGAVRVVVRDPNKSVPDGVESAIGDVLEYPSLERAFQGADAVFHVAGVNKMCVPDATEMYRVNVDGTRNVLKAAAAAGVRRLVYTSSAATIGEASGTVGNEDSVHRAHFYSHYERSKYEAEQVALNEAGDLDVVIVNPSSVQGPGRATGTGKILLDLIAGRLSTVVDTRISIVDIDDCARGHILAGSKGVPGRRYILNSFSMTIQEAVGLLASVIDRPLRVKYLPATVALAGGALIGAAYRLVGKQAPVCREMVRTLVHGHVYDGSRAARELGLSYTSATDTLSRLISWARTESLIP
ncbi:MAG TPA: NAD-dependent epimerase/dehydratase family protein [Acidimicrobiia bacterium]|nr:NAD-dependent epimerase/dehydratase family protein [Acidimicrobiia bacterium]